MDMFGGMGPSSPLAYISLALIVRYILGNCYVNRSSQNDFLVHAKLEKNLQSSKLVPVLYEIRYCSAEVIIIYPTALCKRLELN